MARAGSISLPVAAPTPRHWGRIQRLKNGAIYLAIAGLFKLLCGLGLARCRAIGRVLGATAYQVAVPLRRQALRNLELAFPGQEETWRRRVCRQSFVHLGISTMELLHTDTLLANDASLCLSAQQRELLNTATSEGRGVVAVTGHIGNWELLAQVLAASGLPLVSVARNTYDPRLTALLGEIRQRHGMELLWRRRRTGAFGSALRVIRTLRRKKMLALLIDQDPGPQNGVVVPFFGHHAATPSLAAALALKEGCPLVLGYLHRRKGGGYDLCIERINYDHLRDSSNEPDNLVRAEKSLTALLSARLECAIRLAPEQWVWFHHRWRQP